MKSALAACMPILIAAAPVHAQSVEELEQQLEAQKQINELTRQRVRTLEKQAAEKWDDSAALDARVGLPWGTMPGIGAPYFIEADREAGDNSGIGDISPRAWKKLLLQGDATPSLIGSLSDNAPTGDAAGPAPRGSEFHRFRINLNASKSIDPMVLYGSIFYNNVFSKSINGVEIQPEDSIGASGGASLAITPDITGNLGMSFSFVDKLEVEGINLRGSERTVGFLTLGTGFLIGKQHSPSFPTNIGITDDAPNLTLGVSLPYRF